MNAVMKEVNQNPSEENTDLAVIEPKSLAEILVIGDACPEDFFTNPDYDKHIEAAIEASSNLVYALDESGEKAAKSDATIINKYANKIKGFISATFKRETEEVKLQSDKKNEKVKALLDNRQQLIDQFAEKRQAKLDSITNLLKEQLASCRSETGVKDEFKVKNVDLSSMVKLTGTLTEKGNLTSKAVSFIKAIVDGELAHQNKTENRLLIIANRCLLEDIKPPLTGVHLGADLYADDAVFEETLNRLVTAEIERRNQLKANITKQVVKENQKVLADALAGQQEAAIETVRKELPASSVASEESKPIGFVGTGSMPASSTATQSVQRQDIQPVAPPPGTRTVILTASFEFEGITDKTSNEAVEKFFRGKLPEQMQVKLKSVSSENA